MNKIHTYHSMHSTQQIHYYYLLLLLLLLSMITVGYSINTKIVSTILYQILLIYSILKY